MNGNLHRLNDEKCGTTVGRRAFTGLAAASFLLPVVARAGQSEPRTIALLFDSLISPFWVAAIAAMREYAEERGWTVFEAVSNMDDNRQYAQLQSMLQRGVDGVIMVHTDNKAVIPAIRAANTAGIPLVHFNRPPAPNDGYSVAVVADNRDLMRRTVARLIEMARARGGRYQAVVLLGDLSDANAAARRDGIDDAVRRNQDIVKVVSRVATEWNADKAFAGLSNALQAHPDINMLITSSDFLVPQIEQALKAAGKWHPAGHPEHVMIAGFDGDPGGYRNVRDGYFDVDGVQDLNYEVKLAFDALEAMWAGKKPPKTLFDPGFVLERGTVVQDAPRTWGFTSVQPDGTATAAPAPPASASGGTRLAPGVLVAAAGAFFAALFSFGALGDIALAFFPLAILVIGQLFVLLLGEIDLSMPAVLALASIGGAALMTGPAAGFGAGGASAAGIALCLAIGLFVGFLNGVGVALARLPSFIATLAALMMGSGAAIWFASSVSETTSIGDLPAPFLALGYGSIFGLPFAAVAAAIVAVVAAWTLRRSIYGHWLYALGHNRRAAEFAGVPARRTTIGAFMMSGLCAAIAAILYTARVETGQPTLGATMLLDIVGAAVIGGISLFGGRGTVAMALGGALFFVLLDKSLGLLGLSLFLVLAIKGAAIIAATAWDMWRRSPARAGVAG